MIEIELVIKRGLSGESDYEDIKLPVIPRVRDIIYMDEENLLITEVTFFANKSNVMVFLSPKIE